MIKVPDAASYAAMLFLDKLTAKRAGPSSGTGKVDLRPCRRQLQAFVERGEWPIVNHARSPSAATRRFMQGRR